MDYSWSSPQELQAKLSEMLSARYPGFVTSLAASLEGDTIVIRGEVASEACRGDAKRLALAFDGVFKVRNELIVAGFLEAATDAEDEDFFGQNSRGIGGDRDPFEIEKGRSDVDAGELDSPVIESRRSSVDEKVEVYRRPVLNVSGELTPAEWIQITIDLAPNLGDGGTVVSLGSFAADWDVIDVNVQLVAPWASEVEVVSAHIRVTPAGEPSPAFFKLRTSEAYVEGAPAMVYVSFLHGTRICGHHIVDLAMLQDAAATVPVAAEHTMPKVKLVPHAIGPALVVTIICNGDSGQIWTWDAFVPGAVSKGKGSISVDGSHKAFADSLLRACPDMKPDEFRRSMRGIGERLWHASPLEFQQAYLAIRGRLGRDFPIQLVSEDPHVPWEMIRPDVDGDFDHLFLEHPISRWPLMTLKDSLPVGAVLSFTPSYPTHKALSSAQDEGAWIAENCGGIRMTATRPAFLEILDGEYGKTVGLLHFAGHGQVDTGLMDGGIEFEDAVVGVNEFDNGANKLGRRDGTLVVLNACETAAGGRLLGMNTGWGAAVAAREFGGLIAPLWEVQDDVALQMVQAALPSLLDGNSTLGEAVRTARLAHGNASVAAFAYLAHGDVMARYVTS